MNPNETFDDYITAEYAAQFRPAATCPGGVLNKIIRRTTTRGNAMHVLAIRRPGQRGTRKLMAHYGDRLVCVRYRYDASASKRYKTVEIIIEEAKWSPPPPRTDAPRPALKVDTIEELPVSQEVGVKIFFRESQLREQVKAAGGRWLKSEKLWRVPYQTAISLGLEHRIAKREGF